MKTNFEIVSWYYYNYNNDKTYFINNYVDYLDKSNSRIKDRLILIDVDKIWS